MNSLFIIKILQTQPLAYKCVICILLAPPADPCNPSPCNVNGQCRVVNGAAVCIYPECVINQDCPRDKACFAQKCSDPCVDACGVNALCQVVNHNPVCSCPQGYIGSPRISCQLQPQEPGKFSTSLEFFRLSYFLN